MRLTSIKKGICKHCHKPYSYKHKRKHGLCSCCVQYSRQIKHYYGITLDDYRKILVQQNGVCAICKIAQSGYNNRRLSVDHCHKTGIVRGLLCDDCNNAISKLKDNPILMNNARDYVCESIQKTIRENIDESWDRHFLQMAELIASKSRDPSLQVGCVIVGSDCNVISTGYNGFPRGIEYDDNSRLERPKKYAFMVHAELNAVIHAGRDRAKKGTAYVACVSKNKVGRVPCVECAKSLINAGISNIVMWDVPNIIDKNIPGTWRASLEYSLEMLREAGVRLRYVCE